MEGEAEKAKVSQRDQYKLIYTQVDLFLEGIEAKQNKNKRHINLINFFNRI